MDLVRKWVQALFFLFTNGYWNFPVTRGIYQGPLKVVCSPGLNCYSCPAATTYCPLGALQQLLAGIRMALESGQFFVGFYVVGTMGVIGSFAGRMVCGWACPFGLFQELLFKIPSPKFDVWRPLRYIKYALLVFMVILLPLFAVDEYGLGLPWFCKYLCPAGTLEAGIPMLIIQPGLRANLGLWYPHAYYTARIASKFRAGFCEQVFFPHSLSCMGCFDQSSFLPNIMSTWCFLRPVQ